MLLLSTDSIYINKPRGYIAALAGFAEFDHICMYTQMIYICIYCIGQGAGFSVSARIESGFLQQGDNILVLPANETASVKGVCKIVAIMFVL